MQNVLIVQVPNSSLSVLTDSAAVARHSISVVFTTYSINDLNFYILRCTLHHVYLISLTLLRGIASIEEECNAHAVRSIV